jgi:5'-deoxynucleotidase YfbR-like HD superfamily hydrolase
VSEARRWSALAIFSCALALGLAACATSRFDRLYDAGRYEEAAGVFRADTALHDQERALFRAALMHAMPESPVYDPSEARAELDRLLALYPETGFRTEATHLSGLLRGIERQRQLADEERSRVAELSARLDTLSRRMTGLQDDLGKSRRRLRELETTNARLQAELRSRQDSLGRLRTELRRLKAIDLRSAHDSTGAGSGP